METSRSRRQPDTAVSGIPVAARESSDVRRRLSAPALRTFFNITAAWQISAADERALLGWPPSSTFHKYKSGSPGALSIDTLTRVSLVLGIYKTLHLLYPDPALADRWVSLPNGHPIFGGRPALALMIDGGIDGLLRVRRLLDSRRG